MKINKLLLILLISSLIFTQVKKYRLTPNQNRKLRQAKSLYNNGLTEQAENIYYELFKQSPYLTEAFKPLKNILKNNENWELLSEIISIYKKHNGDNIKTKIEVLDVMIWLDNPEWIKISNDIVINKSIKNQHIKKVLEILLKNNKNDELDILINKLRKIRTKDYYSYEMGIHYSLNMSIDNAMNEFLLHLEYNPRKYSIIKNKILSFPEIKNISDQIKSILISDNSSLSKLILSDLEFRDENFYQSYDLIRQYSSDENDLVEFSDNLIQIQEYELAQEVITNLLNSSTNDKIITISIKQLANIFESLVVVNQSSLKISNQIIRNELLDSPFIKINEDKLLFLQKAIDIFDSLRININDIESTYHLADIKYKILGDLDGANKLYGDIVNNNKNHSNFRSLSIIKTIDIMISKGQLQIAKETLEKFKNEINSKDIYASKEAQILFYLNNWEILNEKNKTYLKKNIKENPYYNDILKITNNIMLFDGDNNSLEKYSKSLLKLFQNKRTESLEIMSSLKNHSNVEIASKIKYEYSHILLSQGNIEEALETIDQIDTDSAYNESAILLKAEIYDYILNDISKAVNVYLYFLDKFPDSIHYDTIRLRLRGLTS